MFKKINILNSSEYIYFKVPAHKEERFVFAV